MYEDLTHIILNWGVPLILAGMLAMIRKIYKENQAIKDSMVLLLRSQIVGKAEDWLEQGYLPNSVRSCIEDMFEQYTLLGGNHGVKALVSKCFELPPKKGEKDDKEN